MRLAAAMINYFTYRQALGERFDTNQRILKAFCHKIGNELEMTAIEPERVTAFLNGSGPLTASWHVRHNALQGFYQYALSRGLVTSSPLPTVKPQRPPAFVPYIYTHEELRRLLAAALTYQKHRGHLEPHLVQMLLLLLYGAGLRVSEALGLTLSDVDLTQAVLTIRDSKFFTSRLVPVSTQLNDRLRQYAARRLKAGHSQSDEAPFFVKRNRQPVSIWNIEDAFGHIRQQAGVSRRDGARYQPRLHDLRHSFAVHRLTTWYEQGQDVQKLLPQLSVYLGHRYLAATSVYLTMTPELLRQAGERFEGYALKGGPHD